MLPLWMDESVSQHYPMRFHHPKKKTRTRTRRNHRCQAEISVKHGRNFGNFLKLSSKRFLESIHHKFQNGIVNFNEKNFYTDIMILVSRKQSPFMRELFSLSQPVSHSKFPPLRNSVSLFIKNITANPTFYYTALITIQHYKYDTMWSERQ